MRNGLFSLRRHRSPLIVIHLKHHHANLRAAITGLSLSLILAAGVTLGADSADIQKDVEAGIEMMTDYFKDAEAFGKQPPSDG